MTSIGRASMIHEDKTKPQPEVLNTNRSVRLTSSLIRQSHS